MRGETSMGTTRASQIPSRRYVPVPRLSHPRRWILALTTPPIVVALLSWWFTAPLEPVSEETATPAATIGTAKPTPTWPEGRSEGPVAKAFLLEWLRDAAIRLESTSGYTATFTRRERIGKKLGPVQTAEMKVRHQPFALYLHFRNPEAGKEVIFAAGHNHDQVIAHPGGIARLLAPRLAMKPDGPLVLADNRHPVTEAGLFNLTRRLVHYRELDIHDATARTILDTVTTPDGRVLPRSIHNHSHYLEGRPFAWVEVWYDPENLHPVRIESHDWPGREGPYRDEDCPLAEEYEYRDVDFDATLTPKDFDPANPDYHFHRL